MARMAVKQARRRSSDPVAGARRSAEAVTGAAQLACVLEASAEKPGNITPRHDFADTSYEDMLRSAIALGPELGRAAERGVGDTVLAAVRATRRVAGANTNLGIALLLTPLARAALLGGTLRERAEEVLGALTLDDARAAYAAIRTAGAGGLETMDNLTYGLVGDHSAGSLLPQAGEQALSSALLALVGLLVAVVLPRVVPVMEQRAAATRFAGGALVLAASGLVLLG